MSRDYTQPQIAVFRSIQEDADGSRREASSLLLLVCSEGKMARKIPGKTSARTPCLNALSRVQPQLHRLSSHARVSSPTSALYGPSMSTYLPSAVKCDTREIIRGLVPTTVEVPLVVSSRVAPFAFQRCFQSSCTLRPNERGCSMHESFCVQDRPHGQGSHRRYDSSGRMLLNPLNEAVYDLHGQ